MPWRKCPYCRKDRKPNRLIGNQVMCFACTEVQLRKNTAPKSKKGGVAVDKEYRDEVYKEERGKAKERKRGLIP